MKKNKIIVNLGGGESRFIQPGVNSDYGRQMLNFIIHLKPHFENKEIIICGGTKIIETILIGATANSIKAITLSNDDYLKLLDEAEILISSPGLNAIFEAMYRSIPIVFLPPQNISQIYQLHSYENAGIALKGLNLSIPNKFLSEEELTLHFLKEIKSKYYEERIINRQLKIISQQLEYIRTYEYQTKIELAKLFLGDLGSQKVSKIINYEMGYN